MRIGVTRSVSANMYVDLDSETVREGGSVCTGMKLLRFSFSEKERVYWAAETVVYTMFHIYIYMMERVGRN